MLPEIHNKREQSSSKTMLLSSQSADNIASASTALPSLKMKSSKRLSQEKVTKKRSKRSSMQRPAEFTRRSSANYEDMDESMISKKKVKTSKVKINPKKIARQFSSATFSGEVNNPLRALVTKNLLEPDSNAARIDIQTFWLYVICLTGRTSFMRCLSNAPCPFATPIAVNMARNRYSANMKLVVYIKQSCRWFRKKIKVKTDFVRNHGWKLVLFWRCIQRRKAVTLLRRMLIDHESFRLPYVMLRYRVNAVHLQRYVRSFLEVTKSRKHALLLKWYKIAAHMKANLIPFLFEQKAKEEEARKRRDRDKWQGVQIDTEILPDIGARVNLITKRTAALQIQIHESEANIQKHRMEMFVKRNKKGRKYKRIEHKDSSTSGDSTPKGPTGHRHNKHRMGSDHSGTDDMELLSSIVSKFIYESRRNCKFVEHHKVIVREKKKKDGMTCDEAKKILTNPFAAKMFAEELSNNGVKVEKIRLVIFSGQQDEAFRLLVENHLRAENGFELKEFCTDYDIYTSTKRNPAAT